MLINGEDKIFAFDRDNNVFRIPNVTFLSAHEDRHLRATLVDAEMIIDKVKILLFLRLFLTVIVVYLTGF